MWLCDPTRVMASSFLRFLDHTQRRTTVGRLSDKYNTHNKICLPNEYINIYIYIYIYIHFLWLCDPTRVMASSFLRFLDHTQRRTTVDSLSDEYNKHKNYVSLINK